MRSGEHIVGNAIYGYRKNKSGKWEHDPPAAEVVREIFDLALAGKTTAQIRDKLFADRRLSPRESVYGFLSCPTVCQHFCIRLFIISANNFSL